MKRTLEQWQGCNPATMMEGVSKRGVIRTLEEAKADILELHAEVERLRSIHALTEEKRRQQEAYYKEVIK